MSFEIGLPAILAFFIVIIIAPGVINYLHKLKFGQPIRKEGPKSHMVKEGTPTMGGIIFLVGIVIACVFFIPRYPGILPVLLVTLAFAVLGFLDDYLKVKRRQNEGLTARQKMAGQLVISAVFVIYMMAFSGIGTAVRIPFTGGMMLRLGIWYLPIMVFIMVGTVNGANLNDGMDGMSSRITILVAVFLTVTAFATGIGLHPMCAAVIGGLMGFLCFNTNKAQVFMGDTGSLALGGFVAASAFMMQVPIYLLIAAFVYVMEVVTVILQVVSFRTRGKRLFLMTPIHHHFQEKGWSEVTVVNVFTIIGAVCCVVAILAY